MSTEVFVQTFQVWVAQYIAVFCMITIIAWGAGTYLFRKQWARSVRDAVTYLVTIAALTLILAFRSAKVDSLLWSPITWFCFSMLLMFELLWIAYLVESVVRAIVASTARYSQNLAGHEMTHRGYPRR